MRGTKRLLDPDSRTSEPMRSLLRAARSDLPDEQRIEGIGGRLVAWQAAPHGGPQGSSPPATSGGGAIGGTGVVAAGIKLATATKLAAVALVTVGIATGGYIDSRQVSEKARAASSGATTAAVGASARAPSRMPASMPPGCAPGLGVPCAPGAAAPAPAPSATIIAAPLTIVAVPAVGATPVTTATPPPAARADESEVAILEAAEDALSSNPMSALARADHHANRFPDGALAQEREVIAIDALMRLGRGDEARYRAQNFYREFPSSAHRQRIEALLNASSTSPHNP
jgi:hypothetical protein